MNRISSKAKTQIGRLVVSGTLGVLMACQSTNIVIVKPDAYRVRRSLFEVTQGKLTPSLTDADYTLVADMATLSAYVYAGQHPIHQRPNYLGPDCAKFIQESQVLFQHGWQPFSFHYRLTPPTAQRMDSGLVYDVWVRKLPYQIPLAVLVFRGTDDAADWLANTRPISNRHSRWDQYEQVRALTPELIAKLVIAYGASLRIFATGHSLGGGLAQHAGYSSTRIEKVFAFNSSPLTGYYDFPKDQRPRVTGGRRIFRIYESNEVLAIPRFLTGFARNFPEQSDVVLVRYNFSTSLANSRGIYQHSMQRLAANLR